MKRLSLLCIGLVLALGCGAKNPAAASNPNQFKFTAALSPANEVPPVTNAEAGGRGTATITMNVTKDTAGTITAATFDFTVDVTGFPANTPITAAHIHPGAAGSNGGALVSMGLGAGEIVLVNGAQVITKTNLTGGTAAQAQDMINNPGNWYFNIHSSLNGGGVARGQLVKQ
jgi:hypothetical protein